MLTVKPSDLMQVHPMGQYKGDRNMDEVLNSSVSPTKAKVYNCRTFTNGAFLMELCGGAMWGLVIFLSEIS